MGLAAHYRFTIYNATGVTISAGNIVIRGRRWKISAGGKVYEANPVTLFSSGASLANGAYLSSANFDNTSANDKWETGDFELTVTLGSTGNGDFTLFYDSSVDGTTFPDLAAGWPIAALRFQASGTKRITFRI